MRNPFVIIVLVGLAVSMIVGIVAYRMTSATPPAPVEGRDVVDAVFVLTAARPMAVGAVVGPGDLHWAPYSRAAAEGRGLITAPRDGAPIPEALVGAAARMDLLQGQPITEGLLFKKGEAGFLSSVLAPGMRAVQIAVSETTGGIGFILPGDRVDLALTFRMDGLQPQGKDQDKEMAAAVPRYVTETILHDLRVLAVGPQSKVEGKQSGKVDTLTVEVDPYGTEIIATAMEMGKVRAVLRSFATSEDPKVRDVQGFATERDVVPSALGAVFDRFDAVRLRMLQERPGGGAGAAPPTAAAPLGAPAPAPRPPVIIYRGVQETAVDLLK